MTCELYTPLLASLSIIISTALYAIVLCQDAFYTSSAFGSWQSFLHFYEDRASPSQDYILSDE